jgi:hypothetical protein
VYHHLLARCSFCQREALDVKGQHGHRNAQADHGDKQAKEDYKQVFTGQTKTLPTDLKFFLGHASLLVIVVF